MRLRAEPVTRSVIFGLLLICLGTFSGSARAQSVDEQPFAVVKRIAREPLQATHRRFALVVGVGTQSQLRHHATRPLRYVSSGAAELAARLRESEFDRVILLHDDALFDKTAAENARRDGSSTKDEVARALHELFGEKDKPGEVRDGDLVLLFLGTHGHIFKDMACLLPTDAQDKLVQGEPVIDSTSVLVLNEIVAKLAAANPRGPKLVIIDACRTLGDEALFDNESPRFQAAIDDVAVSNLCLIQPCAKDRPSFHDEALKHQVLQHFLLHALGGAADFGPYGNGDGLISNLELFQSIAAGVSGYTSTPEFRRRVANPENTPQQPRFGDGSREFDNFVVCPTPLYYVNSLGMRFRRCDLGEFVMTVEPDKPTKIERAFYISTCEVTKGDFAKFVAAENYRSQVERNRLSARSLRKEAFGGGFLPEAGRLDFDRKFEWRDYGWKDYGDDHPVVNVTFDDARKFCEWLNTVERREGGCFAGAVYRLPEFSQWEYACRAGTKSAFNFGGDLRDFLRHGNIADASQKKLLAASEFADWNDGHPFTAPVGSFRPNAWGLFDLHGNVWEWCDERVGEDTSNVPLYAVRGGSYSSTPDVSKSGEYFQWRHDQGGADIGFRVLLDLGKR